MNPGVAFNRTLTPIAPSSPPCQTAYLKVFIYRGCRSAQLGSGGSCLYFLAFIGVLRGKSRYSTASDSLPLPLKTWDN